MITDQLRVDKIVKTDEMFTLHKQLSTYICF